MSKFKITKQQKRLMVIMFVGAFVAFLNQTTINPALPTIMQDFQIDSATAQWLYSGTTLVAAIMVPLNAALIERWTVKKIFVLTMASFAFGCFLTAIGVSFWIILIGRLIQGVGMGVLMPTCVSAIFLIYPEEHRGASMGIYGLVIGVAPVFGPVISGVICDYASWHLIYYITASLSAITVILGIFLLEPIHLTEINNTKISKLSIVMCVIGFGLLLFGFGDIGSRGFSLVSGISIALGLIVSTCFFIYQSKIDNPMLNISVLKSRNFTVSVVIMMCVHAAILGNSILVPLLIQDVMGHSATVSGLVMTPPAIVMGVLSPITGRFFDKHGPRGMCISGLLILTLTTIFLSCLDKNFTAFYLCIVLCLRYVGLALVNMPINTWGVNSLPLKLIPHGNSVCNTFRQTAGSFGTALTVSTFSLVYAYLLGQMDQIEAGVWGIDAAFGFQSILCITALIVALIFVKDSKKKKKLN